MLFANQLNQVFRLIALASMPKRGIQLILYGLRGVRVLD